MESRQQAISKREAVTVLDVVDFMLLDQDVWELPVLESRESDVLHVEIYRQDLIIVQPGAIAIQHYVPLSNDVSEGVQLAVYHHGTCHDAFLKVEADALKVAEILCGVV